MKTLQKTLIAVAAGTLMTAGAQAAVNYGGMTASPYIGAKIGQYNLDVEDADNAMSYGIYGGAKFTPNFGVEAEYLTTSEESADTEINSNLGSLDYSADVMGLYATGEYAFPNTGLYAKGRLGVAKNNIDLTAKNKVTNTSASESLSETGVAGGLGLGYNIMPNASIEAMYNMYPTIKGDDGAKDIDASGITLGAHLKF